MARPTDPVLSWDQLNAGDRVLFYSRDGWKKATILRTNTTNCLLTHETGAQTRTVQVFDVRSLGFDRTNQRSAGKGSSEPDDWNDQALPLTWS